MRLSQVAVQMYSVRDHLKTPEEIRESLARLRQIGYEAVEIAGLGPIEDAELVKILDGEGLVCCSTHEPSDRLLGEPERVIEHLGAIRCTSTAYPFPRGIALDTEHEVRTFAERLDLVGKTLRKAGIDFSYHHHDLEFAHVAGRTILSQLMELTEGTNVKLELDTYWAQAGGVNPVELCDSYRNRMPLVHIKDYGVTLERVPVFEEIGSGNLKWGEIITAAESAGTKWFIVEHDNYFEKNDPFESLKISFDYIKSHLAE